MDLGEPDTKSQWYYDQFDPITLIYRYKRGIDVIFVLGENDMHIQPENEERFGKNLSCIEPNAADRMGILYNKGHGHEVPEEKDLELLFNWFLV